MNRFNADTSVLLVAAAFSLLCSSAFAQEIYKWTDANGKVHYGDRSAAPESSQKMKLASEPPKPPPAVSAPNPETSPRTYIPRPPIVLPPLPSKFDMPKKGVPANPAQVGAACKGLIDKFSAAAPGKDTAALGQQFDSACPGIAYECTAYRSKPQNNQCIWVVRSGTSILRSFDYP
jgi:hypothetical protein